jgi:hypothetical protein
MPNSIRSARRHAIAPRLACALLFSLALPLGCTDDSGADADGDATDGSETDGSESGEASGTCLVYPKANATADVFLGSGAVPGNTCELEVAACGGDVIGNWGMETSCGTDYPLPPNPFERFCPGASHTPMMPTRVGSLSVADDGTWELETSVVYDYEYGADISCLGVFDCGAEAESALTQAGGTASCSGQPFSCTCIVTDSPLETTMLTGTLGPGGTTLDPTGNELPLPFCVEDSVLTLWTLTGSGSSFGDTCSSDADCSTDDQSVGVCTPS